MDLVAKTKDTLARIAAHNPTINALLFTNPDALSEAQAIQEKITNGTAGKLAGKLIALKANICVDGWEITAASKVLEGWKATYDADVVRFLREEDALIIGIANMDEFACGSSGETSAFGPTDNPAAPGHIPGGTSSGSCAAVAADFCDMALGSDTGGSIRNPASHCGIVGVKPSYGRVSRYGLLDQSMSLDQIAPATKTVDDAALLLSVIAQKSDRDAVMRDDSLPDIITHARTPVRIGTVNTFFELCTDKRIADAIAQAAQHYAQVHDMTVQELDIKHMDLAVQTYYPIVYVEFFSATRKYDGRRFGKKIEDVCGTELLRRIIGGQIIAHAEHEGQYYKKALAARTVISKELERAFELCDVIVLPTVPRLPHKLGEDISVADMYSYDVMTVPANLLGICAASLPWTTIDNIPVGLQLFAPPGREDLLFAALRHFEELRGTQ